jgi:hypothetical protein
MYLLFVCLFPPPSPQNVVLLCKVRPIRRLVLHRTSCFKYLGVVAEGRGWAEFLGTVDPNGPLLTAPVVDGHEVLRNK